MMFASLKGQESTLQSCLKQNKKDGGFLVFFTPLGKKLIFDQMEKWTVTLTRCSLHKILELHTSRQRSFCVYLNVLSENANNVGLKV